MHFHYYNVHCSLDFFCLTNIGMSSFYFLKKMFSHSILCVSLKFTLNSCALLHKKIPKNIKTYFDFV